jgi:hypothetical protein
MRSIHRHLLALALVAAAPAWGLPAPSKTAADQTLAARQADLARLEAALADPGVTEALAAQGLTTGDIQARLAQLSPEELAQLAGQVDQLQAAGLQPPNYIWILLAVLLGVLILTALF